MHPFLRKRLATFTLVLAVAAGATTGFSAENTKTGRPEIRVFPVEAITAAMRYDKKTFQELYPGIEVTQTGITDEGFYVRYSHEFLVLFFGPISTVEEGVKFRGDLDYLRLELIKKKPELETSTVHLVSVGHGPDRGDTRMRVEAVEEK
jgi:hypothetical protein